MRADVLEDINKNFDMFSKIFHIAHSKGVITDIELLQYLNEISTLKSSLITTLERANKAGK